MVRVEFKPFLLGGIRRIEDIIPPMRVIVTAGPDEDRVVSFGVRRSAFGVQNDHLTDGAKLELLLSSATQNNISKALP